MNVPKLYPVADPPLVNTKDVQAAIETLSRVVAAQATAINRLNNWAGLVKVSGGDKTPEWLANTLVTPEGVTYETQGGTTPNLIVGDGADERVTMNPGLVTASDTTVKWLWDQLHAGDNIVLTLLNEGASEEVKIASTGGGSVVHLCTTPEWSQTFPEEKAGTSRGTISLDVNTDFPTHLAGQTPDALILRVDANPRAYWLDNGQIGVTKGGDTARDMNVNPIRWATYPAGPPIYWHYLIDMDFTDTGIVRVNTDGYIIDVIVDGNMDVGILLIGWITGAVWSVP